MNALVTAYSYSNVDSPYILNNDTIDEADNRWSSLDTQELTLENKECSWAPLISALENIMLVIYRLAMFVLNFPGFCINQFSSLSALQNHTNSLQAEAGIKMGLANKTKSRCWFNTTLFHLAAVNLYDFIYTLPVHNLPKTSIEQQTALAELQKNLKEVVDLMRNGENGSILNSEVYELTLQSLQNVFDKLYAGPPQDLLNKPNDASFIMTTILDFFGASHWGRMNGIESIQDEQKHYVYQLQTQNTRCPQVSGSLLNHNGFKTKESIFSHLPPNLFIELSVNNASEVITLTESGTVELKEEKGTHINIRIFDVAGVFLSDGHATYLEKIGNEAYTLHNDQRKKILSRKQGERLFLKTGYRFYLKERESNNVNPNS